MTKVLSIGQVAYDITMTLDNFPIENKKQRVNDCVECAGGSAFNCNYLLNKWGIDSTFIGSIGNDYYANKIIEECKSEKIRAILKKNVGKTTVSYIIANTKTGTRTILTDKNMNLNYSEYETNEKYDMIMLDSNEIELSKKIIEDNKNAIIILDAGKCNDDVLNIGKKVTYFICSKDFAEDYSNHKLITNDDYINAYEKIKKEFIDQFVIITLEENGSFTKIDNKYYLVPSIKVNLVDSTGAGDFYHGAFAYFILKKNDILTAMKYANITGAISTEKIGSRYSQPTLEEVMTRGKQNV